ncbi:glutathione S-transferase U18-like [Ananas comosus]|uniref:glutathione transferase n=1 Tax=Ananas comosus TaxID=4615 RepID=A0A6P5FLV8_ANACO|nr:glutathione S-transferase U18-like [Ananas comosus]
MLGNNFPYNMAGSGDEVKLLGAWPSPYVLRVKIALELKGVSYEYLEQQLLENKSELLLKSNPVYKKVPVLIHKNRPICESAIILQYIDEVWAGTGPSLLPPDPYDRAIARFWAGYIDDKWFPITREIIKAKTEKEKAEAVEQSFAGLTLLEEAYEKSYKEKPFFGGDNVGYLDIVLGSFLGWVKAIEKISDIKLIDGAKFPLLAEWAERFYSLAIVKELIPEVDKLVEFAKVLQAIWNANTSIN